MYQCKLCQCSKVLAGDSPTPPQHEMLLFSPDPLASGLFLPTLSLLKVHGVAHVCYDRCGEQVPTHGTCRPPLPPSEKTVLVSGVQGGVMGSRCIRREKRIGGQSYCLQDTLQTGALLACCTLVAQRCRATSLTLVHPSLSLSSSTEAAPEGASMPAKANCKACIALLQ